MTDEQLVAAYLDAGDREILDILIRRHIPRVRQLAYPMLLSHADADDVVQEVCVRVVQRLETYRRDAAFSTWLRRVAMNTIYDFLARRDKAPKCGLSAEAAPEGPPDAQPDNVAIYKELDEKIVAALTGLAPELRAAIVWTVFHGATPAEVAEIEGCSRTTIYWRIHRARKALKQALRDWL